MSGKENLNSNKSPQFEFGQSLSVSPFRVRLHIFFTHTFSFLKDLLVIKISNSYLKVLYKSKKKKKKKMYDGQQHFVDLQENTSSYGDPNSWLSGADSITNSSPTHSQTHPTLGGPTHNANLDRVLFKDLVEIVPLVQSLIDRKASSSFTRRGSVIYTKTPSRESMAKKTAEVKGKNVAQSIPMKKKRDHADKDPSKIGSNNADGDNVPIFSSKNLASDKDREELEVLRTQVEDLQTKLSEKDELLKSAEISKDQMNSIHEKLDELKHQALEKDSLIKSTQQQLSDTKVRLADKQAALEKLQWEATTTNSKSEKLQEELNSMQGDISLIMHLFENLVKNDVHVHVEDYTISPCNLDHLPPIDDLDEMEMQKMEEARKAYVAAVVVAKQKQDEESIAAAASARIHLQSFVFKTKNLVRDFTSSFE